MFTNALRGVVAAVVALTVAHPVAAQARAVATTANAPVITESAVGELAGVYVLTLESTGRAMFDGRLIVERRPGVSVLLAANDGIGAVDHLSLADGTLRGRVSTLDGEGTLTVHRDGDTISGTLVVGKQVWQVHGTRSV